MVLGVSHLRRCQQRLVKMKTFHTVKLTYAVSLLGLLG